MHLIHPNKPLTGRWHAAVSGLLLAGLTSCGGGKASGGSWASWHKGAGFPAETREQGVFCKGAFRIDHKKQMGVDLIKRRRILPVYLELSEDGEWDPHRGEYLPGQSSSDEDGDDDSFSPTESMGLPIHTYDKASDDK